MNMDKRRKQKLTFLITAGPTIEDIDPVRFISNRATGRLGVAMADAVLRAGHRAEFIHGPLSDSVLRSVPRSRRLRTVAVRSAGQMHRAVMQSASRVDVIIMNAAVADYTPVRVAGSKLKKSGRTLILRLKPTVDILRKLGRRRRGFVLIGFALESGVGTTAQERRLSRMREARRKLETKNLDAIVLDTPGAMGAERADFTVIERAGATWHFEGLSKARLAAFLVALGEKLSGFGR
jgi:phosphopantothenoylcysteine decarboxylase / phosphopantothenate---cysteine ligase